MIKTDKVWFNGELVDFKDATTNIFSHAIHYGSSVFEGIRLYNTDKGPAVFRLKEHVKRLFNSAKIYRMDVPYTEEEMIEAIKETCRVNKLENAYIRPVFYRGLYDLSIDPYKCPLEVAVAAWEMNGFLGEESTTKGIKVQVSSWRRPSLNTLPSLAKAGGNYLSSQLIKMEALENGYEEGIGLDYLGNVSEASSENLFLVVGEKLLVPTLASSSLDGITKDTVVKLAKNLGYDVVEQSIPRELLYTCDELFLTGTAAELVPVYSVDKITVGNGDRTVTAKLQKAFNELITGKHEFSREYLDYLR